MTESRLLELVAARMPFPAEVHLDSNLFDDLGYDSVLLLDLIVSIEEQWGREFDEKDLRVEALATPRKLLELISPDGKRARRNV